jgi:hypothetical protein
VRRRLDAQQVRLPAAFDVCVVVDHARLPDMRWLAPLGRRVGALATLAAIEAAGGSVPPTAWNGAQRLCDVAAEAPHWIAQWFGNARLDHSVVTFSIKADPRFPAALLWNVAGEFDADRWQKASASPEIAANNPLLAGKLTVASDRLFATSDGGQGKPRPAMAEKLLIDDGIALRGVVPANSKLWPALASQQLPPATGAEVRFVFGDPAVITLMVDARRGHGQRVVGEGQGAPGAGHEASGRLASAGEVRALEAARRCRARCSIQYQGACRIRGHRGARFLAGDGA